MGLTTCAIIAYIEEAELVMKLQISYYQSLDILLMQNGHPWTDGANVAENVVVFADDERNTVAVEVSEAASLLRQVLYGSQLSRAPQSCAIARARLDEVDLDRPNLPLIIRYD